MKISKDYIKYFKQAKKNLNKEFELDVIREDDMITVNGKYAYSFNDTDEPITQAHIEGALRMVALEIMMDKELPRT